MKIESRLKIPIADISDVVEFSVRGNSSVLSTDIEANNCKNCGQNCNKCTGNCNCNSCSNCNKCK